MRKRSTILVGEVRASGIEPSPPISGGCDASLAVAREVCFGSKADVVGLIPGCPLSAINRHSTRIEEP